MSGTITDIEEAQKDLSDLLDRAAAGEDVVITKGGKPIARLVGVEAQTPPRRVPGRLKGQIWISDHFDAPLPDEIRRAFEGHGD